MEIGQAPSNSWPWSSRELEDKPSSAFESSSSVALARQTSILLVDVVWTILIFAFFLGAAYLIRRSRDVCYTVSTSTHTSSSSTSSSTNRGQHIVIGRNKPHDHLALEINNNLVEVDRGGATASAAGYAGIDLESCSSASASSVGSNLSSFWGSHHALVDIFRLSSKSAKVASSSSMVAQSRLAATASVTLHELDVSSSCRSDDEQAGFALKGRSKRISRSEGCNCGGGVDNGFEELALSFPPGGTYIKHGGSAAAGLGLGGGSRGSRRFRAEGEGAREAEGTGVKMYYHEIHGHEDLEEKNTRSEITLYDAPTTTDHSRVNRRGLLLGAFRDHLENDEHILYDLYERSVEGDREQHHDPGATQSRVRPQAEAQRSLLLSRANANAAASEEPSRPSQSETVRNSEGHNGKHVYNDTISKVTQLQSTSLDYGHFHFSDPDLNDWWRPRA